MCATCEEVLPLPQIQAAAVRVDTENVTAHSHSAMAQDLGNRTEQLAASLQAQSQQLAGRASQLCEASQQAQQVCEAGAYPWGDFFFDDVQFEIQREHFTAFTC